MKKLLILLLATIAVLPLTSAQPHPDVQLPAALQEKYQQQRQAAIQLNELAGHLQSVNDSRSLVDVLAKDFANDLPPMWATGAIRAQIAKAEYRSATDPASLIPEQHIADAWNNYVHQIDAPRDALVTAAEIHSLRDGQYASAAYFWRHGSQTIWTMPNIFATAQDGHLANGCRALESIRLVWDLSNHFENLRNARERLEKGIVLSESLKQKKDSPAKTQTRRSWVTASTRKQDPVETAQRRYIQEQGSTQLSLLLLQLLDDLFPPPPGS